MGFGRETKATHLRISDIDRARMQLNICRGKGRNQPMVPLSRQLPTALREYWKELRPATFLFPGKTPDVPLANDSVERACNVAAVLALSPSTSRHTEE